MFACTEMLFYAAFTLHRKRIIFSPVPESTPYYRLPISTYCRFFLIDLNCSKSMVGRVLVPIFTEHLHPKIDAYSVSPAESEVNSGASRHLF